METISNQNTKSPDTKTITQLLSPWIGILGLLTTVLAVYGYCVMQGVADALHIEGGSLWGAPSDVLHYAFLGLVSVITRLPTGLHMDFMHKVVSDRSYWAYSILLAGLVWVFFRTDTSSQAVARRRAWWKKSRLSLWMQGHFKGIPRYQLAVMASTPLVIPAFLVGVWFVMVCIAVGLFILGWIGIGSGLTYVANNLPVNPYCITAPAPQDITAKAVRCVRVRWQADGQTQSETGILIASTSSYALLIKPGSADGLRVPLNGHAILEAVSQLETAPPTPNTH